MYPPVCFTCDHYLTGDESRVCSNCWNSFTRIESSHPTWQEIKGKLTSEEVVDDLLSCFLFEKEGRLQDVIHRLKYNGMKSLGVRLGREIGNRISSDPVYCGVDGLIPIPLHKLKQRERGYNQSEYICKGIQEITQIPLYSSLIIRKKYTESQTQLDLQQRKENVGNAFTMHPKYSSLVKGKRFILVDDVITTGSTINACANELRARGAVQVFAASVALAQ